jgi:hypothetical protein
VVCKGIKKHMSHKNISTSNTDPGHRPIRSDERRQNTELAGPAAYRGGREVGIREEASSDLQPRQEDLSIISNQKIDHRNAHTVQCCNGERALTKMNPVIQRLDCIE